MIKIIKERTRTTETEFYINFDCKVDKSWGFVFPANYDESPAFDKMSDEAKQNYFECEANQDKFEKWFEKRDIVIVEPAIGECTCGKPVSLDEDFAYMGAVKCEHCGRWYNIFGQSLVDPEYWEDDGDDYYDPCDDYWD